MSRLADVIKGDVFADCLQRAIGQFAPRTILEIGSSDGTGSTSVIIEAMNGAELFCIEMDASRYDSLVRSTAIYSTVHPYYCASVPASGMMSWEMVLSYYNNFPEYDIWRVMGLQGVKEWYDNTVKHIPMMQIPNGIELIKKQHSIDTFDMVLIDGSPFTGMAELTAVYGADLIVMDDTRDIKCHAPLHRLASDKGYQLLEINETHRNGFAVFKKIYHANS